MRADALQRKQRILAEARRLFAERGSEISLDTIAEASEVGIATLYRNFPARDELIMAVILDIVSDIEAVLTEARAEIDESPDHAWERLVHGLVELNLGALSDALGGPRGRRMPPEVSAAQRAALAGIEATLHDLTRQGAVRGELTALEVVVAVGILTRPQPEQIRLATPGLVDHLVEAFLAWSRPSSPLERASAAG